MFKVLLALATILLLFVSQLSYAGDLYRFQQKRYTEQNLSPALKQRLYELKLEYYQQIDRMISEELFEIQIKQDAKTENKTLHKFKEEKFSAEKVTDKELQEFYRENKDRIPYGFDKAKPQLIRYLQARKKTDKRDSYIAELKKKGGFTLLIPLPVPPVFRLNTAGFPTKGTDKAKVTVVEFFDYQCLHCQEAGKDLKEVLPEFKDHVKLVLIDFPVNRSGISKSVAHGAFCAGKQQKYWQYHELAFAGQKTLASGSPLKLATELKLDIDKFKTCLGSKEAREFVERGINEARRLGVHGTPAFFVNGRRLIFNDLKTDLKLAINAALKKEAR